MQFGNATVKVPNNVWMEILCNYFRFVPKNFLFNSVFFYRQEAKTTDNKIREIALFETIEGQMVMRWTEDNF